MSLANYKTQTAAGVLSIRCQALHVALYLVLGLSLPMYAQRPVDTATITFQHVFKGSSPEFVEIKVSEDGMATFDIRQLSQDAQPARFEVGSAVRSKIFQLAQEARN